ncbi:MAG: DUF4942 domain-containing protein [Gemmataceae bacterium]|nr:DUF4942 domain-containing protein [Gemmataceae bacterium]
MTNPEPTTALTTTTKELTVLPPQEEVERAAGWMAREYREATALIRQFILAIKAQTDRLNDAFKVDEPYHYNHFEMGFEYDGHRERIYENDTRWSDRIFGSMKRNAWRVLVDKLGIKNVMSVKRRQEFDEQTITDVILGLADQAKEFARDAAKEAFSILRPRHPHFGGQYKTNDAFRVGRKVILSCYVERCYDGKKFRVTHYHEQELTAVDGVFHLLDGRGIMREHRGPLVKAIEDSPNGQGQTTYFKFKCYKNRNLHLEMLHLDLVKELNGVAAGEYVLGNDMEE